MSTVDELGLAAAEQVERSVGPFIALAAYKRLLPRVLEGPFGARATLGAIRCAAKLGDEREIETLAQRYSGIPHGGDHLAEIIMLCKGLVSAGRRSVAVTLARADATREPRARTFYLLGRCLELIGDAERAFEAFGRAASLADEEKNVADVALAARAKRVQRMLGDRTTAPLAFADAAAADPAGAPPDHKLVIAIGRLRSPSRFVRASGLSLLEELGRDPTTSLGRLAIRIAAEHADALGDALTAVEADRVGAAIRHVPDEVAQKDALTRLVSIVKIAAAKGDGRIDAIAAAGSVAPEIAPLLRRAQGFVGGAQATQTNETVLPTNKNSTPALRLASLGLDVVVALGSGRGQTAIVSLDEAVKIVGDQRMVAIAPSVWTATRLALESTQPSVRAAGVRLAELIVDMAIVPPAMGFTGLARALDVAGRRDLAMHACRAAVNAREPGAHELFGSILRDDAWALAARGQRDAAIAVLREAREHLVDGASSDKGR